MTRVKICGITNLDDAKACIDFGADALGFVFAPESSRFVGNSPDFLRSLRSLPPFISRVALCTTQESIPTEFLELFDTLQFYPKEFLRIPGKWHFQVFPIKDESSFAEIESVLRGELEPRQVQGDSNPPLNAIMLDTFHKNKLGGSGESFDWELALEAKRRFHLPLILAGGLRPDNVVEAIRKVRPYAVDVSSGVEAEPGRKDHSKIRSFIRSAKSA